LQHRIECSAAASSEIKLMKPTDPATPSCQRTCKAKNREAPKRTPGRAQIVLSMASTPGITTASNANVIPTRSAASHQPGSQNQPQSSSKHLQSKRELASSQAHNPHRLPRQHRHRRTPTCTKTKGRCQVCRSQTPGEPRTDSSAPVASCSKPNHFQDLQRTQ